MNSKVEPDELGRVIAGYELVQLSIGDNSLPGWYQHMRFHARVHVATPGSHTQGNGGTRPAVSLGWAPREPTGYLLVVDGTLGKRPARHRAHAGDPVPCRRTLAGLRWE